MFTLFLGSKYKDSRNIGNRSDYKATIDAPLTELQVFPPHFQFTCNQNVIRSLVCFNVYSFSHSFHDIGTVIS